MENVEPTIADEAVPEAPAAASELAAAPDRKNEETLPAPGPSPEPVPKPRGRPQGAKDRQPRTRRPTIRVEPLPAPAEPLRSARDSVAPPTVSRSKPSVERAAATATPVEAALPEPEPPSPRTLYRETSQRLVHLRGLMDEGRWAAAADKYTSRLYTWTA